VRGRAASATASAALAAALLAGPAAAAEDTGEAGSAERELEQLRDAIESSRERVERFEREQRALLERLEEIDRRRTRLLAERRRLEEAASRAEAALAEARDRSAEASRRLEASREAMSRRAVALYKAGAAGPVRLLFSADSLRGMLSRLSLLRAVLRQDTELVAEHRSAREAHESARERAETAARRHREALASLAATRRELAAESEAKRDLLGRAREDRTRERALLIELERAARALEETLARLGEAPPAEGFGPGSGFARRRGSLPRPVPGDVVQPFGRVVDAEYLTQTFRNGVEFSARAGDSVRAVAPGQVRFAGWFRGYGRIVILDHGDGYFTVSGHLDEIFVEVGDPVEQGDTVGTAGETGSLSGPRLYFELRRGGQALDPAEWLRAG